MFGPWAPGSSYFKLGYRRGHVPAVCEDFLFVVKPGREQAILSIIYK